MRKLSMLLCLVLLAAMFAACAGEEDAASSAEGASSVAASPASDAPVADAAAEGDPNVNPAGEMPIVKEKITLSAFLVQPAQVSDLVTNDSTTELENRTNIHLEFVAVPMDGYAEKRSVLLTSGSYPDVFLGNETYGFTNEEVMLYGSKQEVFIPLNDLIEKYGVNVKANVEITPELLVDMTTPDGTIYGLSVWSQAYHMSYPQKMWMNTAWLDTLNLSLPTTTEELYTVLKAFKEQDPNGNGEADEIPLTGAVRWDNGQPQHNIMNAFIYTDRKHFFFINDGHLNYAPTQEEWREGLRYMKRLYDEGLFDAGAFTQSMEQVKQLGTNPDKVVLGAVTTLHPGHFVTISDEPKDARHKDYATVPALAGPGGVQYATHHTGFKGAGFVISDTCQYPEAAFRLGDYLYGEEGSMLVSSGLEGKTWRKAEAGELTALGEPASYYPLNYTHVAGTTHNYNWGNLVFRQDGSDFWGYRSKIARSQDQMSFDGYETRLFFETQNSYDGKKPEEVFSNVFLPVDQVDEAFQMKVNIEDYVNQSMVRFITGDLNLDNDWEAYLQQLEDLQLPRYLQIYDDAYQVKKSL